MVLTGIGRTVDARASGMLICLRVVVLPVTNRHKLLQVVGMLSCLQVATYHLLQSFPQRRQVSLCDCFEIRKPQVGGGHLFLSAF